MIRQRLLKGVKILKKLHSGSNLCLTGIRTLHADNAISISLLGNALKCPSTEASADPVVTRGCENFEILRGF